MRFHTKEDETMQSFQTMLNLQVSIFIIMMVGLFFRKINLITAEGRRCLSELLLNVILPCNIVAAFNMELDAGIWRSIGKVLLLSAGVQVFEYILSKVLYRKVPHGPKEVLQYGTIVSNSGFLGNPMAYGVFGDLGLLYASVAMLPIRVLMWSAGVNLYTKASGRDVFKKIMTHPCIVAVYIGFLVMLMPWQLPGVAVKTLNYVGECTTCVSMLVIGSILAEIQLKSINGKLLLYYCGVRLIAIPLVILGVCRLLGVDALIAGVIILLNAMPAASTTAILAEKYGGDAKFASATIFVSTLLSLITVPLMMLLL